MDAIINLYKPEGMTSFQCVAAVRRILGVKKVGHAGTLDPEASGVLPICVGKATKLLEFFLLCRKSYRGRILLGVSTDTQDVWGECLETGDPSSLSAEDFLAAAAQFVGESEQIPPVYSAVKVDGVPMYKRARRGQTSEVELRPRKICVYDMQASAPGEPRLSEKFGVPVREAELSVACSRGTYIRTICFDLGRKLSLPACMSGLCRTSYGPFPLEEAVTLEELEDGVKAARESGETEALVNGKILFYSPEYILINFPTITLTRRQAARFRSGQETVIEAGQLAFGADTPLCPKPEKGTARLKCEDLLLGIVRFYVGTDLDGADALVVKPWKYLGGEEADECCKMQ